MFESAKSSDFSCGQVCDLLVVGSGAGGLAAAITARSHGLDVVVIEKADTFGGSSSRSAGIIWVPGSRQAVEAGIVDDPADAMRYLAAEAGNQLDRDKAATYLARAPDALAWLEANSHLAYELIPTWPDYHPDQPGASQGGRSLGPRTFDGRTLGRRFAHLRPPLATTMIFGGMLVGRQDLGAFFSVTRSWRSALHIAGLVARHLADRTRYARGTRLSNGNAMVAMLARSALERGVDLRLETPLLDLCVRDGRVSGARVGSRAGAYEITARNGVILASGGFPASEALRRRFYGHARPGDWHRTLAPDSSDGDGLRAAEALGVAVVDRQKQAAAWAPVSLVPQRDGSTLPFPHFFDRNKPGYIAVDRHGKRFVSEARSYHDFVPAMIAACGDDAQIGAFLITDARAIRRYGLGIVPPSPGRIGPHVRSGYVSRGRDLPDLARRLGIDPAGLEATMTRYNRFAAEGADPDFDKGGDAYQRYSGSARQQPNPCVAPLTTPPFYGLRIMPGDIGTFVGLRTDPSARALDQDGGVIPGLYVVGNDAASFMGGAYPGGGITIGPALVFGHLAALHAATAGTD